MKGLVTMNRLGDRWKFDFPWDYLFTDPNPSNAKVIIEAEPFIRWLAQQGIVDWEPIPRGKHNPAPFTMNDDFDPPDHRLINWMFLTYAFTVGDDDAAFLKLKYI